MQRSIRIAILASATLAAGAAAQTVTVGTLYDVSDFGGQRRVSDLPGPDGKVSFREALTAANNTPGPQTIEFAIPRDEWWLVDDMALLRLEDGQDPFLVTGDETTVDFSTQTDFTGDTNPDGTEVGIYGLQANGSGTPAIIVMASDCEFRGLGTVHQRSSSISVWSGDRHRFVGNATGLIELSPYMTTTTGNVIGGADAADGNDLGGVAIRCGASDNVIIGNRIDNVTVAGHAGCADPPSRNRIGGPAPEDRNVINGFGRIGHEGLPIGAGINVERAHDTLIEGNYIGVTEDGTASAGQSGPTGVMVADAAGTTIRGNLISGLRVAGFDHYFGQLFGQAILVTTVNADTLDTVIEGNLIGTDATGQSPIPTLNGVVVRSLTYDDSVRRTRVGGTGPGQANTIAFTDRTGVLVLDPAMDAEISGNSIHSNGQLGIDLGTWSDGADGVTPNDAGDADFAGGNELQNFPVLTGAEVAGGGVRVAGALGSRPGRVYRVELFAGGACGPGGHGQGERFIGAVEITTDGAGDATIDATFDAQVVPGEFVTATATDAGTGATSEFSACVEATSGACAPDFNGDGVVNTQDVLAFLNAWTARDPKADFNGDGVINTQDVLAFLNAWTAGC